jgi:fermentation-respiration switch protein FrsA (DUF1100 family)
MATFDAFALVPLLGQRPLLSIVGTRAATSWMSVETFQKAVDSKEIFWLDGASHLDLYGKQQYLDPAIDKLTDFFHDNLGSAA